MVRKRRRANIWSWSGQMERWWGGETGRVRGRKTWAGNQRGAKEREELARVVWTTLLCGTVEGLPRLHVRGKGAGTVGCTSNADSQRHACTAVACSHSHDTEAEL